MTQSAQQIIRSIEIFISKKDLENVQSSIDILPLSEVPKKVFDGLFVRFINTAYQYQCNDIALYLLDTWEKVNDDDQLPYDTYLFFLNELDLPILQWLMKLISEVSSAELHLDILTNYEDQSITVSRAAQRVIDTYGLTSFTVDRVEQLIELSRMNTNGYMERFFLELKAKIAEPSKKPDWVRNVHSFETLPSEEDLMEEADEIANELESKPVQILATDDAVELLTAGLPREGLTIEEMEYSKDVIKSFYTGLTNAQKIALLANGEHAKDKYYLNEDKKLFSYLGPSNIIYDANLNEDHPCCFYGGDRMFLCNCFEHYDEDEDNQDVAEDDVDWFTGSCNYCGNVIEKRWYALRLPLVHGGWSGCYCSFDCLTQVSENIIQDQKISLLKANIGIIGIQDRE